MIPKIIMALWLLARLCWVAHKHDEPRDEYNFWKTLIVGAVLIALLWWGGFWN